MYRHGTTSSSSVKALPAGWTRTTPAFSLVELLAVIALLTVLVALTLPSLRGVRDQASTARRLVDMHTVATAVIQYASESRDLPPTIFTPPSAWPERWRTVRIAGVPITGSWFASTEQFYMLLDPFLPDSVLRAGFTWSETRRTDRGDTVEWAPYRPTATLYAAPEYWVPERQRPLLGWNAERIDGVMLPSRKGMCAIPEYVDPSTLLAPGEPIIPLVSRDRPAYVMPIAWFDLSVSNTPESSLVPGVANRFRMNVDPARYSIYDDGPAVHQTRWGLAGFDRQ